MTLTDLPVSLQLKIMECLSDGRDLVCLGQVCPELGTLTEDRLIWKRLCQYHFTDRQVHKNTFTYWLKQKVTRTHPLFVECSSVGYYGLPLSGHVSFNIHVTKITYT